MTSAAEAAKLVPAPWHAAYPTPKREAKSISRSEVLSMLIDGENIARKDFVLVDLRRNDHEARAGGSIRGSINLPAQTLFPTIPTVYNMFKAAGLRHVIWYCGSSRGRGNRAAGWFADYIAGKEDSDMRSLVLLGGIKGWAEAGGDFVKWIDEYEKVVWGKDSA
ncbi:Rhodanese-like protein [Thozetella sp. PMI_491]|nr:Rhodanese-like protein [Thozetella sp. PMI_491]